MVITPHTLMHFLKFLRGSLALFFLMAFRRAPPPPPPPPLCSICEAQTFFLAVAVRSDDFSLSSSVLTVMKTYQLLKTSTLTLNMISVFVSSAESV